MSIREAATAAVAVMVAATDTGRSLLALAG
jgi:hypothetical protein